MSDSRNKKRTEAISGCEAEGSEHVREENRDEREVLAFMPCFGRFKSGSLNRSGPRFTPREVKHLDEHGKHEILGVLGSAGSEFFLLFTAIRMHTCCVRTDLISM